MYPKEPLDNRWPPPQDFEIFLDEARVVAERNALYGDATKGHANLGLCWSGILQNHYGIRLSHPIPASVVLLMLSANKINRAVLPTSGKLDDFVDMRNYARLSEEALKKERENEAS